MPKRKIFDPSSVPASFWSRDEVRTHLARRDVGALMRAFLAAFPECTQTQLALVTEHDRADVSNWVRGARQGRVSDIDVLTRIADGLSMPDHARLLLGLAPAEAVEPSAVRVPTQQQNAAPLDRAPASAPRIAICGSRSKDCDNEALDAAVRALARLVLARRYAVSHGPVGIGIEVMTYIADHYRPADFLRTVGIFGRINVVRDVRYVIAAGGGAGTRDELDLARDLGVPVLAIPPTGGTAARFHHEAERDHALRSWATPEQIDLLHACATVDDYVRFIESVLTLDSGAAL